MMIFLCLTCFVAGKLPITQFAGINFLLLRAISVPITVLPITLLTFTSRASVFVIHHSLAVPVALHKSFHRRLPDHNTLP